MKVYLAGPINGCTDAEANDWRAEFRAMAWSTAVRFINPMRRDYRGREDESYHELVALDKVDVAACDVIVASCPKPSVGTSMEVLLANQLGRFIVAVVPEGAAVSPWLRFHATYVVRSYTDAAELVREHWRDVYQGW